MALIAQGGPIELARWYDWGAIADVTQSGNGEKIQFSANSMMGGLRITENYWSQTVSLESAECTISR
jgi:hypothetical protein